MSSLTPIRILRSDPEARAYAKARRERNAASGSCVNHDGRKRTHGSRCFTCYLHHRYGRQWETVYPRPWLRSDLLRAELALIARAG